MEDITSAIDASVSIGKNELQMQFSTSNSLAAPTKLKIVLFFFIKSRGGSNDKMNNRIRIHYIVNYYKHFMHVLQTGIKSKLRIDVRARPVTSYQHCLPLLLTIFV